jgi:hypothetical protein
LFRFSLTSIYWGVLTKLVVSYWHGTMESIMKRLDNKVAIGTAFRNESKRALQKHLARKARRDRKLSTGSRGLGEVIFASGGQK